MDFFEIATLLGLIGGAIFGTINVCYIVYKVIADNKKDNRPSDQT